MKNLLPPVWAPNAVATDRGWINPNTGEVLISYRGLKTLIKNKNENEKNKDITERKY